MITLSQQYRIIKDYFHSFQKHRIINTKITDNEIKKIKQRYDYEKFETFTLTDFKILILLLLLENRFTSVSVLLQHLSETSIKDLRKILRKKDDITAYKSVIMIDRESVQGLHLDIDTVFSLHKKGKISVLFLFWFLNNNEDKIQGRIKKGYYERLKTFMLFFPKIQEYLSSL